MDECADRPTHRHCRAAVWPADATDAEGVQGGIERAHPPRVNPRLERTRQATAGALPLAPLCKNLPPRSGLPALTRLFLPSAACGPRPDVALMEVAGRFPRGRDCILLCIRDAVATPRNFVPASIPGCGAASRRVPCPVSPDSVTFSPACTVHHESRWKMPPRGRIRSLNRRATARVGSGLRSGEAGGCCRVAGWTGNRPWVFVVPGGSGPPRTTCVRVTSRPCRQ